MLVEPAVAPLVSQYRVWAKSDGRDGDEASGNQAERVVHGEEKTKGVRARQRDGRKGPGDCGESGEVAQWRQSSS